MAVLYHWSFLNPSYLEPRGCTLLNPEPLVILVDENDQQIGTMPKQEAHEKALRHRAFSVFIYRKSQQDIEILLQQRHKDKYHCGGLWTNTCCSHPYPNEDIITAGERRLYEEMGIKTSLKEIGVFHYIAEFANGLTENEIDHVLVGELQQAHFTVNAQEVMNHQWVSLPTLLDELKQRPHKYTPWLLPAVEIMFNNFAFFKDHKQDQ